MKEPSLNEINFLSSHPQFVLTIVEQYHTGVHMHIYTHTHERWYFCLLLPSCSHGHHLVIFFFPWISFYPVAELTGFTSRSDLLIFKQLSDSLAILSLRTLLNHPKARRSCTLSRSNYFSILIIFHAVFWVLHFVICRLQ